MFQYIEGASVALNVGSVVGDAVLPPGIVDFGLAVGNAPPDSGDAVGSFDAGLALAASSISSKSSDGCSATTAEDDNDGMLDGYTALHQHLIHSY